MSVKPRMLTSQMVMLGGHAQPIGFRSVEGRAVFVHVGADIGLAQGQWQIRNIRRNVGPPGKAFGRATEDWLQQQLA